MAVSLPHMYQRAKATTVSDNRATWPPGPGCGTRRRWQGQAAVLVGDGGAWPGYSQRPSPTGVEGAGGTGGPGCGARGWRRQGQGGPRGESYSAQQAHWCGGHRRDRRARPLGPWAAAGPGCGARGRRRGLAGLRGAAPNAVRPPSLAGGRALRRPEHPWGSKQRRRSVRATSNTKPPGPTRDRAAHASGR